MKGDISAERAAFLMEDFERGFIEHCRLKAREASSGRFCSEVEIAPCHRQQDGFIHAGLMATMADHTAGYAGFTIVPAEFQILSIEFKINFLRPAYGDRLICRSRVLRGGRQIIIAESEVYDRAEGVERLAAKAMVTLMAVHRDNLASKR